LYQFPRHCGLRCFLKKCVLVEVRSFLPVCPLLPGLTERGLLIGVHFLGHSFRGSKGTVLAIDSAQVFHDRADLLALTDRGLPVEVAPIFYRLDPDEGHRGKIR
jgi:hypothetical protein